MDNTSVLSQIAARRSVSRLCAPGPSQEELRGAFEAAACAPDHGRLRPWRFIVLRPPEYDSFGGVLEHSYTSRCSGEGEVPDPAKQAKERTKLGRAPMVIVAAAIHKEHARIPWIEQQYAVAAAVQNLLLALNAQGYGSMWRTGDAAYDTGVKAALGLSADDAIVGFIYVGTPVDPTTRERRVDVDSCVDEWSSSGSRVS